MQEDKEPTFDAADSLSLAIAAMAGMIDDLEADPKAMSTALRDGFPTATDIADWLVRELGMPFRSAHHATGRIVALAEERGCQLAELPLEVMQEVEAGIMDGIYSVLSAEASVSSRTSLAARRRSESAKRRRRQGSYIFEPFNFVDIYCGILGRTTGRVWKEGRSQI